MSDHAKKLLKNKPIKHYIIHEVSEDVFKAKFMPISHSRDYDEVRSLEMKDPNIGSSERAALDRLKESLNKVMPMSIETDDDVMEAAFAISSRILTGFTHCPSTRF